MQIKHKRVNVKTTVDRGTDMDNMSNINEQLSFEHEKRLKDFIPRKLISTCMRLQLDRKYGGANQDL